MAVVHLVWIPFGPDLFLSFIRSYQEHSAGYPHDLIILFNGVRQEEDTAAYHAMLNEMGIVYSSYSLPSGQDIEAYYYVAQHLEHEYILFLNSYSRLLADNWGVYYLNAIKSGHVGAVSATGSWQSYYSSIFINHPYGWERNKTFAENYRKYKLFIKAILYWRFLFRPFPNPHLRTNAFMVKRDLFLSVKVAPPTYKFAAYIFESGKKGFSGQLLSRGYELLVVDKKGSVYKKEDWKKSATFRISRQENLLVSDNQTRIYDNASQSEKEKLAYLSWGR